MFGTKKLKARIAELEKENYNLESDRKQAFDELLDMERLKNASENDGFTLRKEIEKLKKSLEIEHESFIDQKGISKNLRGQLNTALDFIKSEGYSVHTADTEDLNVSFSGKSKLSVELEEKLKAREGLIDNLNHLRAKEQKEICELYANIDILNEKISARQVRSNKRKQ